MFKITLYCHKPRKRLPDNGWSVHVCLKGSDRMIYSVYRDGLFNDDDYYNVDGYIKIEDIAWWAVVPVGKGAK